MASSILKTATRLLVGLVLIFSVYLLLRGHNAPGGGFAAALVAGTGFALFTISEGPAVVRQAVRIAPQKIALSGLGLALASGLAAPLAGRPFLSAPVAALLGLVFISQPARIFSHDLRHPTYPLDRPLGLVEPWDDSIVPNLYRFGEALGRIVADPPGEVD